MAADRDQPVAWQQPGDDGHVYIRCRGHTDRGVGRNQIRRRRHGKLLRRADYLNRYRWHHQHAWAEGHQDPGRDGRKVYVAACSSSTLARCSRHDANRFQRQRFGAR
ncbi:MAG: hypothetical protein H7A20_01755 [Rhodanobacteraceae bacterium]|nr:hypothetical protein [Rhodanobacteraceae bacterium]